MAARWSTTMLNLIQTPDPPYPTQAAARMGPASPALTPQLTPIQPPHRRLATMLNVFQRPDRPYPIHRRLAAMLNVFQRPDRPYPTQAVARIRPASGTLPLQPAPIQASRQGSTAMLKLVQTPGPPYPTQAAARRSPALPALTLQPRTLHRSHQGSTAVQRVAHCAVLLPVVVDAVWTTAAVSYRPEVPLTFPLQDPRAFRAARTAKPVRRAHPASHALAVAASAIWGLRVHLRIALVAATAWTTAVGVIRLNVSRDCRTIIAEAVAVRANAARRGRMAATASPLRRADTVRARGNATLRIASAVATGPSALWARKTSPAAATAQRVKTVPETAVRASA